MFVLLLIIYTFLVRTPLVEENRFGVVVKFGLYNFSYFAGYDKLGALVGSYEKETIAFNYPIPEEIIFTKSLVDWSSSTEPLSLKT